MEVKKKQGDSYVIADTLCISNLDMHRKIEDNAAEGLREMLAHGPEKDSWNKRNNKIRTSKSTSKNTYKDKGFKSITELDMQDICSSYFYQVELNSHPNKKTRDELYTLYADFLDMSSENFISLLNKMNLARNYRSHGHHLKFTTQPNSSQRRSDNVEVLLNTVDELLGACVQKGKLEDCQPFLEINASLRVTFDELKKVSRCQRSFQDLRERFDFKTQQKVTVSFLIDMLHVVENGNAEEKNEVVNLAHLMITRQNPEACPSGLKRWGLGLDAKAPHGYYTEFPRSTKTPPPPPPAPAPAPKPFPARTPPAPSKKKG